MRSPFASQSLEHQSSTSLASGTQNKVSEYRNNIPARIALSSCVYLRRKENGEKALVFAG